MNKKTLRVAIIIIVVLACALGLWLFRGQVSSLRLSTKANRLVAQGEYEKAKDIFSQIGDADMVSRCEELIAHRRYTDAKALLDSGDFEAAKELFLTVKDHLDAAELINKCDYLRGCSLEEQGELMAALEVFREIEDCPGSGEKLEQLSGQLYSQGIELMMGCAFNDAYYVFSALGEYLDSADMASRCSARFNMAADSTRAIVSPENIYGSFPGGKLYIAETGYVFIPDRCDETTDFLIFFPGGRDIEEPRDFIYNCIEGCDNTIILFLYRNGLYDMESKAEAALKTLGKAADECGVALKAPLLCGTSMGAYPAMKAAAYYYVNHSLNVPKVLCFDAGVDWEETDLILSASECRTLAESGTELWLFEQQGVGMDREGIRLMVLSGCNVTVIACENGEHNAILYNALDNGMMGYAQGKNESENMSSYTFARIYPYSAYPE